MFEDWVSEMASVSVDGLGRGRLCDVVAAAVRVRSAADALEARALAAISGLDDGGAPTSAVARAAGRCTQREADRRARRADTLAALPEAADALAQGALSVEHIDSLARAVEATSPEAVAGSGLIGAAGRRPADMHARDAREWTRRQQSDADLLAAHRRRYDNRRLVVFDNDDDMTVLHGETDKITGARVRSVLDIETDRLYRLDGGRGHADKVRTVEQRRMDALVGLILGEPETGPGRHRDSQDRDTRDTGAAGRGGRVPVRNQILITATLTDGELADAHLADGSPLPRTVLERLACGSDLYALVLSTAGDPLWIGRRTRLATDGQWRTLIARDGGCVICDAHPSRCEAHHVIVWQPPGCGPTDIDNLALLCTHHHHLVHDNGHQLIKTADGGWTLQPP